ncbi:MAG: nitrous oxide reductase family maturation protein NosD [Phycisphaeraceae bacterium]|nr:nitrous oxide reductase family maturation protein NosD [Phycisphaeraceae bacterium]
MRRFRGIILGLFASASVAAPQQSPGPQRQPVAVVTAMIDAAAPGSVVRLPPGVYEGNLVIRKPVTLDGGGKAVFDGLGRGTVIEIAVAGVSLRGCTVRASGDDVTGESAAIRAITGPVTIESNRVEDALYGIDLREAPGSVIRDNIIHCKPLDPERRGDGIRLWWSHGVVVERNAVHQSRDIVFWYSENLIVRHNTVTGSRYGLHFMYSHDTTLSHNVLSDNSVGVYLMYSNDIALTDNRMINNRGASGYGLGLKDCDGIVIKGNALLANRVGVYIDNSPCSVGSTGLFESNMIAFNEIGLLATPNTHSNVFVANAFIENEQPATTHGRGQLTSNVFARDGVGNYWSDYAGLDLDGDGIGDTPYEPRSLFGAMLTAEPNLRLFVHTPAQRAIEFTARALPELRPVPMLIDPAPLAVPPTVGSEIADAPGSRAPMAALAAGLLLSAIGSAFALGRERRALPVPEGNNA